MSRRWWSEKVSMVGIELLSSLGVSMFIFFTNSERQLTQRRTKISQKILHLVWQQLRGPDQHGQCVCHQRPQYSNNDIGVGRPSNVALDVFPQPFDRFVFCH